MKIFAIGVIIGIAATVAYALSSPDEPEPEAEFEILGTVVIDGDIAGGLISSPLNDLRRNADWN